MSEYENFCEELREKSKVIHEKSDKLVQLKLAVALTDLRLYGKVLGDFYCIFNAIEEGIQQNITQKHIKALWIPALERSKYFERDLSYYHGLGWKEMLKPSDKARKYVSHIQDISNEEPELLVAYIHTMYLAIFSGGYIIRGIVRRTLGITGPDGLEIFGVAEGETRKRIKSHIKGTINEMELDRDTKDRIVQEKINIFVRNNEIVSCINPKMSSFKRIIKFAVVVIFLLFLILYFLFK